MLILLILSLVSLAPQLSLSTKALNTTILSLADSKNHHSSTKSCTNMTAIRERSTFHIPNTPLNLHITLDPSASIPQADVAACIQGASRIALSQQSRTALLEEVFRYQAPEGQARFGIVGGIFVQELTWADVDTVLNGLTLYFSQTRSYVEIDF